MIIVNVFVLIFGLILGSFFNVCIFRIPKEESIAYPPSHCMNCDNEIKWYDLIPVLSYILLRGKCRHCNEKISIRYPIIEMLTGILFLGVYLTYGMTILTIKFIVLVSFLIIIGMIDFDTTDVYECTTIPCIITGVIFVIAAYFLKQDFLTLILGGIAAGGIIAIIILLTNGMGWGDAEICLMCGLFLGLKLVLLMLFLSIVIGGVVGIVLLALKIKTRKDYIPFGPFIAVAAIITVLWGQNLISFYFNLIM